MNKALLDAMISLKPNLRAVHLTPPRMDALLLDPGMNIDPDIFKRYGVNNIARFDYKTIRVQRIRWEDITRP